MIFYKRFPGDYARDTQHLTTLEHGIYALLLDYLYSTEKPIQSFEDACRISKVHVSANKRACRRVLLHFFTEGPLGYTQKRVEEEISLAESKKAQCRRNADARWSQCKNDANGNASQTPDSRQPEKAEETPLCANLGLHGSGSSQKPPDESPAAVKRVWLYYIEKLGKDSRLLTLTPTRKQKGLARLAECLKKTSGDLPRAEALMCCAVDALAGSAYHRGDNDKKTKYDSWEGNLFKSQEQLEKWLERA